MESVKESTSIQALQNEPYQDSIDHSELDPDVCSWNKKLYPDSKLINLSGKLKPISLRSCSPKSCPKPSKRWNIEKKEPYSVNVYTLLANTPTHGLRIRNFSITGQKILPENNKKKLNTPEPCLLKISQDSPKIIKYSNYLNHLAVRKLKLKQMIKPKPQGSKGFMNIENSKMLEMFLKAHSPHGEARKTPGLQKRLPLSTAQTLEELLQNTKIGKLNKKYYKYKLH